MLTRAALMLALLPVFAGCQPYRIEHHKRPSFYQRAAMGKLPDEVRLEDGTIIRYTTYDEPTGGKAKSAAPQRKPMMIREEHEDGSVTLRCFIPEHVLVNLLECLRKQEYDLIWHQLLAEHTRQEFEAQGGGMDECTTHFRKHRHELVATLTRMVAGLPTQQTRFDPMGNGVIRARIRPQHVGKLKFKYFDLTREGIELKLLNMGG
jgi:hypothetical protein